jgi:hypothetical protein
MCSSGMLCHVAVVRIDVSEELSASIIRVTRIGELGTRLAVASVGLLVTANLVPSTRILVTLIYGGTMILQNVSTYKSHTM